MNRRPACRSGAAGDKEKLLADKIRLAGLERNYSRFCKGTGQATRQQRLRADGFGPGRAARVTSSANTTVPNAPRAAYTDITGTWYPDARPNSHAVRDLSAYTVNGTTYTVDGHNVVLDYSAHEKEIAELLEREVGGEIFMVPRVNNPQGVSTPDYLFHNKGYDLKTIGKSAGANTIFNRVKKAAGQARSFIIDVTQSQLDDRTIDSQIEKIFWSDNTKFIDELVIIRDMKIVKVVKRA